MNKGSYSLLLEIKESNSVEVGVLGKIELLKGFYVYNGSAFGPGGLKRVQRHKKKSGQQKGCHWHIDYLLTLRNSQIVEVFTKESSHHECSLSKDMKRVFDFIEDFGCSDCGCVTHLFYSRDRKELHGFLDKFYS